MPRTQTGEGLDTVLNQPPSLKLRRAKEVSLRLHRAYPPPIACARRGPGVAEWRIRSTESLLPKAHRDILYSVAKIAELEKLALDLPEAQRAILAAHLLRSLPPVLHDEDEGIAEALVRDAEFETNPDLGMSLQQLQQEIERRRG